MDRCIWALGQGFLVLFCGAHLNNAMHFRWNYTHHVCIITGGLGWTWHEALSVEWLARSDWALHPRELWYRPIP